jgi:hypothetical protein
MERAGSRIFPREDKKVSSISESAVGGPPGLGRYVPLLVLAAALLVVLLLPLRIISYGYMPTDDALADAAKAITGKPWPEILVLKSDYAIDNHIGWHALLRGVHLLTNWPDEKLMLFSMTALFTLVGWSALPWLKRPEAWLITLVLTLSLQTPFVNRFISGRPFLWSMFALVTILFLWHARGSAPPDKPACAAMTGLIALAVLLHGVWYFWALPVAAFFFARQFRWGAAFSVCWVAGVTLGAVATGRPVVYLVEAWRQALGVIGLHATQGTMVGELRPASGNWFPLLLLGGLLILRQLARLPAPPWSRQPAFCLACVGWILGFQSQRFWDDWGLPALMVLLALDLDLFLQLRLPADSVRRLAVTGGLAATVFLTATNDANSRWSASAAGEYLTENDSNLAGWLPEPGGIFYEADMEFFYRTFFRNPAAPWRYMAGFEPAFMPADDFVTYQQVLANGGNPEAYRPWVKKMRPQDRVALNMAGQPSALLPELEWKNAFGTLWLGRWPRKE